MRASMAAFYRLIGERSPGGEFFEREGVMAAIAPSCPQRSVVNAVVYEDAGALLAARDELERAYSRAGVEAWTVWVPEADSAVAARLWAAGHVLDASPRAMALELDRAELDGGAADVDWEQTEDVAALAAINEAAYGLPSGEFSRVMTALAGPGAGATLYIARLDGEPAACALTVDARDECGVFMVATAPRAQRRGLAMALMRQALLDAQERGATTSTLQATRFGHPLYERLGYRDLGAIEMWERRASSRPAA
jgi:GNAT superfamily N-acetyltransferase